MILSWDHPNIAENIITLQHYLPPLIHNQNKTLQGGCNSVSGIKTKTQQVYETVPMFINAETPNRNSDITIEKSYQIRLFISNLMENVLKFVIKNIQLPLSCSDLSRYKNCFLPWQLMLIAPIAIIFSIYTILSNYIPHDICIPYCLIYSTLNPKIPFPCMFLDNLNENFHPT